MALPNVGVRRRRGEQHETSASLKRLSGCFCVAIVALFSWDSYLIMNGGSDIMLGASSWSSVQTKQQNLLNDCPFAKKDDKQLSWCNQRHAELNSKLQVEQRLIRERIEATKQRSLRNEYARQHPEQWKTQYQEHYRTVQSILKEASEANPQLAAPSNFTHKSFPDLSILGFPKAGTSHLFQILATHPDATPIFKRKEFCMDHGHFLDVAAKPSYSNETVTALIKNLYRYHKHVHKVRNQLREEYLLHRCSSKNRNAQQEHCQTHRRLMINACLQPDEVPYHLAYSELNADAKFIFLLRDPADWLWASWNFWWDRDWDGYRAQNHDWASVESQYRSPEAFHEILLAGLKSKTYARKFYTMRQQTVELPRQIISLLGRDRVLFLKSEDLSSAQTIQRLSEFTGLEVHKFNQTLIQSRSNCNAKKGYSEACDSKRSSGAYEIAGHRDMLKMTRTLVHLHFLEECRVYAEEFGIRYPDCLQVMKQVNDIT